MLESRKRVLIRMYTLYESTYRPAPIAYNTLNTVSIKFNMYIYSNYWHKPYAPRRYNPLINLIKNVSLHPKAINLRQICVSRSEIHWKPLSFHPPLPPPLRPFPFPLSPLPSSSRIAHLVRREHIHHQTVISTTRYLDIRIKGYASSLTATTPDPPFELPRPRRSW